MAVERETPVQAQLPEETVVEREQNKREFIGKGWLNVTQKGEHAGQEYINITLDQDINKLSIVKGNRLLLWPNEKREELNPKTGKPYADADYRVSLVHSVA